MGAGEIEDISKDTVIGIEAIAAYTGISKRKAYHLASTDQLPGAFRIGTNWALLKSVYAAELRSRATKQTIVREHA